MCNNSTLNTAINGILSYSVIFSAFGSEDLKQKILDSK